MMKGPAELLQLRRVERTPATRCSPALLQEGTPKILRRGHHLYEQEGTRNPLSLVLKGVVTRSHMDEQGNELIIGIHGPDELVGIHRAFSRTGKSFDTATAYTPAVEVVHFDADLPSRNSELRGMVDRQLTIQYRRDTEMATRLAYCTARERTLLMLADLADRFGVLRPNGETVIQFPITNQYFSTMVGSRPETLTRALQLLIKEGLVKKEGKRFVIPNVRALRTACA